VASIASAQTRGLDRVGTDPSTDRDAGLVLLVAFRVAEVRDDRGDAVGTRPLECVDPEQQLHEVVVGREDRRLNDVDLTTADVLEDSHEEVAVRDAHGLACTGVGSELGADAGRQVAARGATEDEEIAVGSPHAC
jgi:hypothetical protein